MPDLPQHAAYPGYVDPFYEDRPWIQEWVTDPGPSYSSHILRIREPSSPAWMSHVFDPDPQPVMTFREIIMYRHRCWGAAPYVGDPFHYEWWVGVDDVGRQVASVEACIVYEPYPYVWTG